ncbi:MAG: hemerythrin domain-containing protein [Betaproteobacteria bacterium]|nr:hemerythrin domain-containing protein [Betaproteobacteria bacterium]
MDAFVWNERFATRIDSVDAQHRKLVDLVNRVGDMLVDAASVGDEKLQIVFRQLAEYAHFHFADEERVMSAAGLDPRFVAPHVGHHRGFVEQLGAMWQARTGMKNPAESLHGFLASWLTFHILGEDLSMARQIERMRAGKTAAEAFAQESRLADTPTAVLLEALQNLYGVLALQNRDLAEANRSLEEKVAARTRELLQSEKMASVGQLAAGVAHEINNPIGFVNSNFGTLVHYVEQLLQLAELGSTTAEGQRLAEEVGLDFLRTDVHDLLKESQEGLERVRKIVADLKDFSHVDEAQWQEADLLAGLESTLNVVWHEIKYKAEIVRELQPLPLVRCIPAQINQVFVNLLLNAAQAIAEHGIITLRSGRAGERVWIEIADSGCGMDDETRRRLFEPFFTTKPVGKGTGLGLSVTWDIIKKHAGTIDVTSKPGQGSVFHIWLPVAGPGT